MVKPKSRQRQSRSAAFRSGDRRPTSRMKALLISPLLVTALYALIPKDGTAEALRTAQTARAVPSWTSRTTEVAAVPLTLQGSQVLLNGRSLPVAWSQRQQEIGVADAGLIQAFGFNLLDTEDPARQPVQWFSQPPIQPLVLGTWLTPQYRYLSITELAEQLNWQVRANGGTLQVTTPPSRVTAVRQGRQSWGDRIVIDLDQAAPWQLSEQGSEFTVTIDAAIDPAAAQGFIAAPGNRLTDLKVEAIGNQTRIRVAIPSSLRPRVWTLPSPSRLVIDVRPDSLTARNLVWAPGIRWQQQFVRSGTAAFPVTALVLDPRQPGLALKPIWSDPASSVGTAPLITTAQRWQAIAAINGGFFNRNNQLPLGAVRQESRWVSGPILNRGAIAWNDAGELRVGRLSLVETVRLPTGQRFAVSTLNSGYVQAGVARYTRDWGATYQPILDQEVIVVVRGNQVVEQRATNGAGQMAALIPEDGYLLVIRSDRTAATALATGTTVALETATVPAEFSGFPHILGAGPLLIADRRIVLDAEAERFSANFIQQAAPRSAIGTTADGKILLVTIHQRVGGAGPTLRETAQVMQQLGAVNALNLDGGSSTGLYLGGQLLNRSPRTAARVHSSIGVFMQPTP